MNLLQAVILEMVIYVKDDRQMLGSILKTTQIGQVSIRKILDSSMGPNLRKTIQSQLREYDSIESEAHALAGQRGWELHEIQPGKRLMAVITTHMKLSHGNSDSKIAEYIIHSNTRNMIQGLKNLHQYRKPDSQITFLSQRLLDCETANVRQMQNFL